MRNEARGSRGGGARERSRAWRLGFSAAGYLGQARRGLTEASLRQRQGSSALRFATAHLAALRCAAAVLAARGRPSRRRAASAWVELLDVAPELRRWAAVFTESAALREAAEAGLPFPLDHDEVDAFCLVVRDFLDEVEELLEGHGQTRLPTAS